MRAFSVGRGVLRETLAVVVMALGLALQTHAAVATSWAVLDADKGVFLGDEGGSHIQPPASLAKMMTLYLTFEAIHQGRLGWNDRIRFSRNASAKIPMKLWVRPGDAISVREAVDGMIVISANDAATAIGEHLSGSEAAFGRLMTRRARQLGMRSTIFTNPSGLTDGRRQATTARDMALLGLALKRDFPAEYHLFSKPSFVFRGKRLNGHNNLMYRYAGVDGIKTGFTDLAGYNIVSSLNSNRHHLIGVVLGGKTAKRRDDRMEALLSRFSGENGNSPARQPLVAMRVPVPTPRPLQETAMAEPEFEQGDGGGFSVPPIAIWQVQIAAMPSGGEARALLEKAARMAGFSGAEVRAHVEPVASGGKTLYRARFAGFEDQAAALRACAALKRRNFDCIAVEAP
jgi:D-alanyl-D-alanine carboxypeptidase/D-alanyl-D-alanine carboxypeptidase (penicillin-binding protein 5/6)